MADRLTKQARSRAMARVGSKNTAPELRIRRALHAEGLRFRLHRNDLPGSPDLVLPKYRIAVFVHGCFWHGHDCPRGKRPLSNTDFWNAKLDRNIERDARAQRELNAQGWTVVIAWECALDRGVEEVRLLVQASAREIESAR